MARKRMVRIQQVDILPDLYQLNIYREKVQLAGMVCSREKWGFIFSVNLKNSSVSISALSLWQNVAMPLFFE